MINDCMWWASRIRTDCPGSVMSGCCAEFQSTLHCYDTRGLRCWQRHGECALPTLRFRRPMDFDGDCPQTGRCRRPSMVVIMDTCNSCKAHSVPMTTPASDMYGHTENHCTYDTARRCSNKSPPKFVFLKSHNTSSSPSAYASFELPRSSKSMAWMMDPLRVSVGPLLRDTVPEYNNNNQNNK